MIDVYPYKEKELVTWLKDKIDWLVTHNKNYTKQQYFTICDIQTAINEFKVVENGKD